MARKTKYNFYKMIKKYLIFILIWLLLPYSVEGAEKNIETDLNTDGKIDKISLLYRKNIGDDFLYEKIVSTSILLINGISQEVNNLTYDLKIVDIDKKDKYHEVMIVYTLYSGGSGHDIYKFDGKTIKKIGSFPAWLEFTGYNIMYADFNQEFWSKRERYVFNVKKNVFVHTPQELYYLGKKNVLINKDFPVYLNRSNLNSLIKLKAGSYITLLAVDYSEKSCKNKSGKINDWGCEWYLIKSSSGLLGWVRRYNLREHLKLSVPPG